MIKKIILGTVLVLVIVFLYQSRNYVNVGTYFSKVSNSAAAFFAVGIDVGDLVRRYSLVAYKGKIKILIVPGHEPDFGGAEYKDLKERDLNLALSEKLKNILAKNPKFEIITTRDTNGWNPALASYVNNNKKEIQAWSNSAKKEMSRLVRNGQIASLAGQLGRRSVPANSALWLYGINKWTSDNKVDIAIHLHFNDNPKYKGEPNYKGFSIYVPEKQYSNALSSKILAQDLMAEIAKINEKSNMPLEDGTIIEDQELIALGSHNTADSLSVLVEYAYIYEKFMQKPEVRNAFIDQAASSTAVAVNNFFESRI
ncbi:MAG: N-acetylmuramoyl-L-alanine amidase [Candidatus Vogelbacteria bacterium]|nr:N-acetylmuramoyl-L-alanine amidase [Candidatus Vogelbacteria bacterium]